MQTNRDTITILIISTTIVILTFILITITILYAYKKKQTSYYNYLQQLRNEYEKNILNARLEIQEQTFQHISREIHDNIGLSLTLAKLNLTTINYNTHFVDKINQSIDLISTSIQQLRNISHTMNSELVRNNGLIKGIDEEMSRINSTGTIQFNLDINGKSLFLDGHKELLIFRIIQEGINNIIKHSEATQAKIQLEYDATLLKILISDNGKGFSNNNSANGSGLLNIKHRIQTLEGDFKIESNSNGTNLLLTIPL